ncbi:uncharacterized protein LOC108917397 [Anoplophora glabripennis]|uniref:uncharacterized protein LOC108917397 n=1 Tax=Anoplophora glabripennis TaxID=217634 RepID=UPI000C783C45|nr:uncharacterized protein LOC108917397 [Anoplophora glabripennis]
MSGSESKENDDVKVTVTADVQIQESIPQQSSEVQVKPDVVSTGIQITDTEMKTASTQTDRQPKKLCLDTNCVVTIPASVPKLCKIEKLSVQHMPPIDIKRKLVVQRVLKFYIDSQGRTHYISQSKARNSKFYELVHTSHQSNLKIRFEKELRDWLKSASSELSFFLTNKHSVALPYTKPPSAGRMGSVSDGELVIIRKKQLKESMKPKSTDKLESLSKELILKSFHIYDNPNMHDPGETKLPLNVNSMDTSVYKTYINPDGLPNAASTSINRTGIIITPETLQKISQHKPVYIKNQMSFGETKKSTAAKKNQTVAISATEKKQSDPSCSPNNVPINLYDLGLYSAKSTQVETSSFKSSVSSTPEKPKIETENVDPPKTSISSYDKDTNMSYEKISITVSYSSEETVNSESFKSQDFEQQKVSDYVQKHERELHIVEPIHQTTVPETKTTSRLGSQDTFQQLKEKFAKEGYNHKDKVCDIPSVQSLESTIPEFIMSLTESTSHDLKKILPHIRKNVTGSVHSKSNMAYSETGSGRKLYTDNHESGYKNSSSKAKQSKNDFTVLSMQIHGDCVPNDSNLMNSHLKLGKNGRYKDEENLFCENRPKVASLPLRRRMLKNTPRSNYVNKYAFDSSSGDALSVEPSFSEGEIKCHSSVSIGEVHRKPQLDHFSKFRPKITHNNPSSDANVIRERRTYFNHWITYYINKNARIPLLSQSSSTSSN